MSESLRQPGQFPEIEQTASGGVDMSEAKAGELKLPEVGGRTLSTSNAKFEHKCLMHLAEEQKKILPDNSIVDLLCESVRCVREYNDFAAASFKSDGENLERRISDNQKIRALESQLAEMRGRVEGKNERDSIAIQIMAAQCTRCGFQGGPWDSLARYSYEAADALLKCRATRPTPSKEKGVPT